METIIRWFTTSITLNAHGIVISSGIWVYLLILVILCFRKLFQHQFNRDRTGIVMVHLLFFIALCFILDAVLFPFSLTFNEIQWIRNPLDLPFELVAYPSSGVLQTQLILTYIMLGISWIMLALSIPLIRIYEKGRQTSFGYVIRRSFTLGLCLFALQIIMDYLVLDTLHVRFDLLLICLIGSILGSGIYLLFSHHFFRFKKGTLFLED